MDHRIETEKRIQEFEKSIGIRLYEWQKVLLARITEEYESSNEKHTFFYGGRRNCGVGIVREYMKMLEKEFKEV